MSFLSFLKNVFSQTSPQVLPLNTSFLAKAPIAKRYEQIPSSPLSKTNFSWNEDEIYFSSYSISDSSYKIKLYRFLRDNIPALNSAVWTWTRLCSSPSYFQLKGSEDAELLKMGERVIFDLDQRIYQHDFVKFGGTDALLSQFFLSLFTDGAVCGEIVLAPSRDRIDKFYFIDPTSICFKFKQSRWELYQQVGDDLIRLNPASTFYVGLDIDAGDIRGKSIFASIPFIARIEQKMVEDMGKSMHNAGYHRLHVRIKPPERLPGETDENYINRANKYFEDTVDMMKKISVEENPITWNDVEILYIGPQAKISASNYWYLNHKALMEDICCGVHLDPFMLGYSYGTTQNWAQFKYEMVLRNAVSIQRYAKRFIEWIRNIELALWGLPLTCEHHFDNRKAFGMLEQRKAEQIHLDNIIKKKEKGLITEEEAKAEVEGI
jgi:hypothetical protein